MINEPEMYLTDMDDLKFEADSDEMDQPEDFDPKFFNLSPMEIEESDWEISDLTVTMEEPHERISNSRTKSESR